ncbi:hypothetical protein [Pontibacter sp. G13]|uniref:hypothetical protein n=1 Tax=Pontibacter sp. G13 TaxID=3074898 RepID=UPI00288BECDA|nr:hypothetical protein [Pontibacter sp. G13]WNJ21548.1 hypothetical protein RJD25_03950 [Pontibacter sp. G13]
MHPILVAHGTSFSIHLIVRLLPLEPIPILIPLPIPTRHQHSEGEIVIIRIDLRGVAIDVFEYGIGDLELTVGEDGEHIAEVVGALVALASEYQTVSRDRIGRLPGLGVFLIA